MTTPHNAEPIVSILYNILITYDMETWEAGNLRKSLGINSSIVTKRLKILGRLEFYFTSLRFDWFEFSYLRLWRYTFGFTTRCDNMIGAGRGISDADFDFLLVVGWLSLARFGCCSVEQ
jgi:hypothetical protein